MSRTTKPLTDTERDLVAIVTAIREAFEPVRGWYDGDGQITDLAEMIGAATRDLMDDRREVLAAQRRKGVAFFPPERVLIDPRSGEAVGYRRASKEGIEPDFVLVRDDGWTFGARWGDSSAAWALWPESWVFFAYRAADDWKIAKLEDFGAVMLDGLAASRDSSC